MREATASAPTKYRPEITIRYHVDGTTYDETTYDITQRYSTDREAVQAIVAGFEVGKKYPCWYDPLDPTSPWWCAAIAAGCTYCC